MFKSVLIVVALLLVGSLATQAGASGADTDTLPDERVTAVATAILNHDFSPAIATLPTYLRGDSELADRYIGSLKLGISAAGDGDEQVLAAREINGLYWIEGETLNLVSQYHYNHDGTFPINGAALFPELATPAGEAAFFAMTDQEKLEKYYAGVNPYTGKFYASFDPEEWRAGGLDLSPLPEGFAYSAGPGKGQLAHSGGYTYQIFGTVQDSVLFDDYCTYAFGDDADTAASQMEIDTEAFRAEADAQIQEHIENQDN